MGFSFVRSRSLVSTLGLLTLFALAACGSDSDSPAGPENGGQNGTNDPDPVATTSVEVQDFSFSPPAITVAPGATVTWTWVGSDAHNVTWDGGSLPASPTQTEGNYQVTMPQAAGQYGYSCTLHAGMQGTVTVD